MTQKRVIINNGYYNIKSKNLIFKSCCKETTSIAPFSETIKYKGRTYVVGYGQPNLSISKDTNDINKILILYALARLIPEDIAHIDLVLSAPPMSYKAQKNDLQLYLIGKHEICYNDRDYKTFYIDNVTVLPETFVVYAVNNDNGQYDEDVVVIIDIGGFTTNICKIDNSDFDLDDVFSYPHGMYHLDTAISQYLNQSYSQYNFNCSDTDISRYRKNGLYIDAIEGNIMDIEKNNIELIYNDFVNDIIGNYIKKGWNISDYKKIITGGGGLTLYPVIKKNFFKNAILSKDPIFDNYNGLEVIYNLMEQ